MLGNRSLVNPAADGADGKCQPERGEESDDADEQTELHGRPRLGGTGGDQDGDNQQCRDDVGQHRRKQAGEGPAVRY